MPFRPAAALLLLAGLAATLSADIATIRELIRAGRVAEALSQCDRELESSPRSAALLTLKGLALQAKGEKAASLAAFRQALAVDPAAMAALQAAAQLEFESRDPQARGRLEAILRLAPATHPARAMLATLLFESRDCAAATPHLARLPAEPAVRWQRGVCAFELRRWSEAAAEFAALLQLREHSPTRFNLALAQFNARDFRAAAVTLDKAADVDSLRLLAAALVEARETPKAITVLQRAVEQFPDDERPIVDVGIVCMDHKAWQLGEEVLAAGLRRWPASARLHTLLGVLRVRAGEIDRAQAAFRAASSGLGDIGLASILMQMGLPGDAVQMLRGHRQDAAAANDSQVDVTLARALLQIGGAGELDEATRLLEAVIRREPGNAVAQSLLGRARVARKEWALAEKALLQAIRLDGKDRTAHYQLMTVYQRTGRLTLAAAEARKVRALAAEEQSAETEAGRFQLIRAE